MTDNVTDTDTETFYQAMYGTETLGSGGAVTGGADFYTLNGHE